MSETDVVTLEQLGLTPEDFTGDIAAHMATVTGQATEVGG